MVIELGKILRCLIRFCFLLQFFELMPEAFEFVLEQAFLLGASKSFATRTCTGHVFTDVAFDCFIYWIARPKLVLLLDGSRRESILLSSPKQSLFLSHRAQTCFFSSSLLSMGADRQVRGG